MNTKGVGEKTEAILIAQLIRRGETILLPFGDNQRYDLVLDRDGQFIRVQCKTGRILEYNGVIEFATCSSSVHRGGQRRDYRGQVEYFAVYCPQNDKCYFVPVEDVGVRTGVLRLRDTKNSQTKNIRWAKDYEI